MTVRKGDRVRVVRSDGYKLTQGEVYSVIKAGTLRGHNIVEIFVDGFSGKDGLGSYRVHSSNLELITRKSTLPTWF